MKEELKQVAERIRGICEIAGISAETMARELAIPLAHYQQLQVTGGKL